METHACYEAFASVSRCTSRLHNKGTSSDTTIRKQLEQIDVLQNMGISRHFDGEIKRILDMTYRYQYL